MKIRKFIPILALSMIMTACGNQADPTNINTKAKEEIQTPSTTETTDDSTDDFADQKQVIYTSIYPIYNLTKQIAGDKFEVRNFSNLKTESHGWEPSAKDMAELSEASILFINGAGMEEWKESVEDSIETEIVDTTVDVDLLKTDENHDHEDQDYEEYEHNHGIYDPHTWLSPVAVKGQAKVIVEKLSEIDPANADYYMANYEKIARELDEIIVEYKEKFASAPHKNFLVNHKAYSYIARDFDLNQYALTDLTSTGDEGAKDVKNMIDLANELGINTVFYEKGTEGKSAKTIAEEIGADTVGLNTMEFATDEELSNETTYQELVRENLEALYQSMNN